MKQKVIPSVLTLMSLLIFMSYAPTYAQGGERMDRIKAQRVAFFTEKLNLSEQEAAKFWPVYNDYNNRRDMITNESRNLSLFVARNADNMSDAEVQESMKKFIDLQNQEHDLFIEYNNKYLEILPARKVMKLYIAENQFKQFLLNQLRERERPERRF
jgi:hypothetical protein